ncbi:hypothetical protein PCANC_22904 [Puccinia coronata f. sp. avenae]|uniref:Uncharacterized protein n=1 Tax=Puccinia coronata f. sp. avenae TaxID=200324 RepID=A0A2N5UCC0_9BASI|nr:hypothetical protein PCANC_22904 [Puccinia coronata f. sp. avenae]PLW35361.1 hypothetical protein PCASD_15523 [Puccinia coronata f. sp. avenae]
MSQGVVNILAQSSSHFIVGALTLVESLPAATQTRFKLEKLYNFDSYDDSDLCSNGGDAEENGEDDIGNSRPPVLNIIRNSLLQEKRKSLQKGLKQASKDAKQVLKGNIQTPSKPVAAGSRRSAQLGQCCPWPWDGKLPVNQEPAVTIAHNPFAALGGDTNKIGGGAGLLPKPSAAELAPTGRPQLNLAPRTLPLPGQLAEGKGAEKKEGTGDDADGSPPKAVMRDEDARQRVKNSVIGFFHVRSLDESFESFLAIPESVHHELVHGRLEKVLEKKAVNVDLTASLFQRLAKEFDITPRLASLPA